MLRCVRCHQLRARVRERHGDVMVHVARACPAALHPRAPRGKWLSFIFKTNVFVYTRYMYSLLDDSYEMYQALKMTVIAIVAQPAHAGHTGSPGGC